MMDKIEFNREKYKLGHTMVFFRAGGLALLEEARDAIVLKLVRQLQAEVFKKIKSEDWKKRRDQKELIRVCQRQFRKFIALRDWGEYISILSHFPKSSMLNFRMVHHSPENPASNWSKKS